MMQMVYVTLVIAGVSLQAPEPVTSEACDALKADHPQTLCIDVEPPCGKGEATRCLGRADLEERPVVKKPPKKKRTATYRRRSSSQRTARR